MIETPSIFISFFAGVVSFLAPCVLPIMPSYLSYLAGISLSESYVRLEQKKSRWKLVFHSILFSIGFIGIFILIGAAVGKISAVFLLNKRLFQQIGGLIIILFGLMTAGVIKFKTLEQDYHIHAPKFLEKMKGYFFFDYLRSLLLGVLFAFGWSPCYGPIVGVILSLVAIKGSASIGMMLFFVYGFGFMVPFIITAFFVSSFTNFLKKFQHGLKYFRWTASAFLILLGVLLLTGDFNDLVNFLTAKYAESNFNFFNL